MRGKSEQRRRLTNLPTLSGIAHHSRVRDGGPPRRAALTSSDGTTWIGWSWRDLLHAKEVLDKRCSYRVF